VRRFRERQRLASEARAPLLFERPDWRLFTEPHSLPQKAGCEPDQIGLAVVKETDGQRFGLWCQKSQRHRGCVAVPGA